MRRLASTGPTLRLWIRRSWSPAALTALVLCTIPAPSQPQEPAVSAADTVKAAVNVVTAAFARKDGRAEQEAIRQVSQSLFDWNSMAKQALGREWRLRTPQEQEEFVKLFARLIEQNYLATIRRYHGEVIEYGSTVKGDEAVVRMSVNTKSPVRIDYRMRVLNNKEWRVNDVVIKDSSVIQSYRAQFERILRDASYKELVARIREKTVAGAMTD